MSTQNPELDYSNLTDVLDFVVDEKLKQIHTAMPGRIVDYDPRTKRATVQPAIDWLMTDGSTRRRPVISNVPVMQPSAGGMTVLLPVRQGDPVMLLVSERGLTEFKRSLQESRPDVSRFFSLGDSVALLGFGAREIGPAYTDAVCIQAEDNSSHIALREDGRTEIYNEASTRVRTTTARIEAESEIVLDAPSITIRGGSVRFVRR